MRIAILAGVALAAWMLLSSFCLADEEIVVSGYEEAFDRLRQSHNPNYHGSTVEEAIKALFEGGEVDEGTYSPTDYWDRDGDIRRTKPPQLSYNGRTYFKYSDDNISGIDKVEKELELNLRYEDWSGYFRFSDVTPFAYKADPMRWEKGNVRYRGGDTKATVGTYGAVFGRGLAVNMYEERTLDFDNEAEGFKVEQGWGDANLTVMWGTRKDLEQYQNSEITAARVDFPAGDSAKIGINSAKVRFPEITSFADMPVIYDYNILGGDFTIREGDFRLFAEIVKVGRDEHPDAATQWDFEGSDGRGVYLNAGYNGDGYSLNAEYKDYRAIGQPFSVLPALRKFREQATAEPSDDKGYAAELNWNPFEDGSSFTFNYAQGNIHAKGFPYRELGAAYSSPVLSDTSFVIEFWDVDIHGDKQNIQGLTVSHQIDEDWTATTYLERERRRIVGFDSHMDYIAEGEVSFGSEWALIYTYEKTGKDVAGGKDTWGLWETRYKPDQDQEINISYGARREGFVCSGGICRLEPEFDGFKIDYLRRF